MFRLPVFTRRKVILLGFDALLWICSYFLGLLFIYILHDDRQTFSQYLITGAIFFVSIFIFRLIFSIYTNVWRFANSRVYLHMVLADAVGGLIAFLVINGIPALFFDFWHCVAIVGVFDILSLSSRFTYQQIYRLRKRAKGNDEKNQIKVAIVGAGQIGALLAEELLCRDNSPYRPLFFIDIDGEKVDSYISGLRVYREDDSVLSLIRSEGVQEIFLAFPATNSQTATRINEFYSKTGCRIKVYDYPLTSQSVPAADKRTLRDVRIEDLLFRESLTINDENALSYYSGKTVLITGGGGSIGSEICRQIARLSPRRLIIFDIYENNAYDIQQELIARYGDTLDLVVEIGSIRDRARLDAVFAAYRPEIVFHAAAHKHVPLMEHSNSEVIKNNIFGTYNTADMAEKYGARKFILISTDKAVNPTNIMGASKRMCEMVLQCRQDSQTVFAAVRFGNVLGSNGSVIPLFRRQIEQGGPVTITDKRIIRYFMTIPEASQLVMRAGVMAKRGELFVLNMGKPVKILNLAENMIRLTGLRPYKDIEIKEIGLRPGEKLYEELLMKTEHLEKTENDMIFIERDNTLTREEIEEKLAILREAVRVAEHDIAAKSIRDAMKAVVPTFREPEEVNQGAETAREMQEVCK